MEAEWLDYNEMIIFPVEDLHLKLAEREKVIYAPGVDIKQLQRWMVDLREIVVALIGRLRRFEEHLPQARQSPESSAFPPEVLEEKIKQTDLKLQVLKDFLARFEKHVAQETLRAAAAKYPETVREEAMRLLRERDLKRMAILQRTDRDRDLIEAEAREVEEFYDQQLETLGRP